MPLQGPGSSVKAIKGTAAKGMILPFDPMALTFSKVSYFVPFPKVTHNPSFAVHNYSCLEKCIPLQATPASLRRVSLHCVVDGPQW